MSIINSHNHRKLVMLLVVGPVVILGLWFVRMQPSGKIPLRNHDADHSHSDIYNNNATNRTGVYLHPQEIDFGQELQGNVVRRNFTFHNNSTNLVRIVALETTCQCTTTPSNLMGLTLNPRTSVSIPISLDTTGKDGSSQSSLVVMVEDHRHSTIVKCMGSLKGLVVADFSFNPHFADFGVVAPGSSNTVNITFTPNLLRDVEINPEPNPPYYATVRSSPNGKILQLTFIAPQSQKRFPVHGEIVLKTSSGRMPLVKIPISAIVVPDLDVTPSSIILGNGDADFDGNITLTLQSRAKTRVLQVYCNTENGQKVKILDGLVISQDGFVDPDSPCRLKFPKLALRRALSVFIETANLNSIDSTQKTNTTELQVKHISL